MTNRPRLRLEEYLLRIVEIVDDTALFVDGMFPEQFLNTLMVIRATERNIEIIGELLHQVEVGYPEFAQTHDEIPFRLAYDMRNLLAHTYWKSEAEIIWEAAVNHVPAIRFAVMKALSES